MLRALGHVLHVTVGLGMVHLQYFLDCSSIMAVQKYVQWHANKFKQIEVQKPKVEKAREVIRAEKNSSFQKQCCKW